MPARPKAKTAKAGRENPAKKATRSPSNSPEVVPAGLRKIGLHICEDGRHGWVLAPIGDAKQGTCARCGAKAEIGAWLRNGASHAKPIDFGNALDLAMTMGVTPPLAEYLRRHDLTEDDRLLLAGYVDSLDRRPVGRPREEWWRGPAIPDPTELPRNERDQWWWRNRTDEKVGRRPARLHQAKRDAAYLVRLWQNEWRSQHGRENVPRGVTDGMITRAIKRAATSLRVEKDDVNELAVLDLLRTGRVHRF